MRVFFDTNVLIAAFATRGLCADLFAHDLEMNPRDTFARVSRGLQTLSDAGLIVRYTSGGRPFMEVATWSDHQRIDRPNKARYPRYERDRDTLATDSRHSREDSAAGAGEQGNRGTGEQGNRGTDSSAIASRAIDLDALFDSAYASWPKKVERKKSLEKFRQACKTRDPHELTEDVIRFGQAYAATTEPQFVPALNVWLNGERWTDELPQPRTAASTGHERAAARQAANMAVVEHFRNAESGNTIWEIEA